MSKLKVCVEIIKCLHLIRLGHLHHVFSLNVRCDPCVYVAPEEDNKRAFRQKKLCK